MIMLRMTVLILWHILRGCFCSPPVVICGWRCSWIVEISLLTSGVVICKPICRRRAGDGATSPYAWELCRSIYFYLQATSYASKTLYIWVHRCRLLRRAINHTSLELPIHSITQSAQLRLLYQRFSKRGWRPTRGAQSRVWVGREKMFKYYTPINACNGGYW